MGIHLFSSDNYPKEISIFPPPILPGNPDPANYTIIDTLTIGNLLIVEIKYPSCHNYEGKKILVYEGVSWRKLREQELIDPHFSNNKKFLSPIARFEPTEKGWRMAETFAKAWSNL